MQSSKQTKRTKQPSPANLLMPFTNIPEILLVFYCWFSHDVTKFQTSELLILLKFYFHYV